jgi:hypothetical protein
LVTYYCQKGITLTIISLKMPQELVTRLVAAARRRGINRSALVRDALESYLRGGGGSAGSAAEVAGDLIGAVEGPGDLSHDPRHLRDFGR